MSEEDPFTRPNDVPASDENAQLPDDLIDELDKALEGLTADAEQPFELADISSEANPELGPDDGIRQMQETFLALSRNTLSPIGRYMKAITLGEYARELLEISEYVVTSLIPKVEAVGLNQHAEDLTFFRSLVLLALGETEQTGSQAMREVVMKGFISLCDRFGLQYRGYRLAVRNLVEFYRAVRVTDGVSEMDLRRFFAIGVPSLTWVRRTRVSEMVSLSGISPSAMSQIRKLAYVYRSVPPERSAKLAQPQDERATVPTQPPAVLGDLVSVEEVADAGVIGFDEVPPTLGEA
ncbi:MAG TPA: hypothetical protein VI895_07265 [Bdellovibrionota bacterium]|nr:hypothetical protein [Bdellovibrionota bacterium]